MGQKPIHIHEILTILELPLSSWKLNGALPPPDQANVILNTFKKLIKKQHRVLVKKYHPDLPKNGEKEEMRMKQINAMIDLVMQLKIQVMRRPQPIVRYYTFRSAFTSGATDSTTSGSTTFTFR